MGGFFLIFIIVVIGFIGYSFYANAKARDYKQTFVIKVLKEIFDDVDYHYMDGYKRERIYETKLVNKGNSYSSGDYLKASYKGIPFEFGDVVVQDETSDGEHTHTTTYFYGQWVIIKPQKKINGKLYVLDRHHSYASPQGGVIFKDKTIERVHLESDEFNKEFRVFASDPQEAFYILTPPMVLKFLDIHREDVSFYQNDREIHIAIYSREDLLEPKMFNSLSEAEDASRIKESMMRVIQYIDLFIEKGN